MRSYKKGILLLTGSALLFAGEYVSAYDNKTTHRIISGVAVTKSVIQTDANTLTKLGLMPLIVKQRFPNTERTNGVKSCLLT